MKKFVEDELYHDLKKDSDLFEKKIESDMHYNSDYSGNILSFDWLEVLEQTCPYIDNVIRNPKLILINEEVVTKIEKSKKITVASVKDLARHTNYISKVKDNGDVQPSKILDIRSEETYNIYENRFLYTLIGMTDSFLAKKEEQLKNFKITNEKVLEYSANSKLEDKKVDIELRITSYEESRQELNKKLKDSIEDAKKRIKLIRDYISSWLRSEMYKDLDSKHVPLVLPPIKKTNIILKNPNFQLAVKLWDYLQHYDQENEEDNQENLETEGNDDLKEFLNYSFMVNYYMINSISKSKREQKQKLVDYAMIMLTEEIDRAMTLLLNNGITISNNELFNLLSKEMKKDRSNRLVGVDDVKKKFKSAIDEYLERTENY